ncbi:hypothetical protein ACFVR1_04810 [Psychrobacillus sp. NPDC058041]|uniref:hypothetical protein n=1 Tax=Psychrobacillus sp. NPDC058041 TaxID=3346310 RepID=UPI0036D87E5A
MKKLTSTILAIVFGTVLVLTGCGSNNSKVTDGVNKMLDTTTQLSKAIDNGDQEKVKEVGPKLEDQWKTFEDDVKKENKDLYEKIENYLDPTIAGSEAAELDKEALKILNDQLTNALEELADKTK